MTSAKVTRTVVQKLDTGGAPVFQAALELQKNAAGQLAICAIAPLHLKPQKQSADIKNSRGVKEHVEWVQQGRIGMGRQRAVVTVGDTEYNVEFSVTLRREAEQTATPRSEPIDF